MNVESTKRRVAGWLRQGVTPFRLALTLALGFAIGCIPVIGIPTVLCAGLALLCGLNLPAIQAANYAAMPLQIVLILPFIRLGQWLFAWGPHQKLNAGMLLHLSPNHFASQLGWLAGEAVLAWVMVAVPTVAVMTAMLTLILRKLSGMSLAQAAD